MKRCFAIAVLCSAAILMTAPMSAGTERDNRNKKETRPFSERFQIGGYGEVTGTYNFFSDEYLRYTDAASYTDAPGHGRIDIPHFVIWLGYDFGKGWSLGTEIEFEHGGTESAVEIETEEAGEYESEVERGGEVALEQFWIQKSFSRAANLRMGHIIVPVGGTNMYHMPTEFFTCYRPEGENTILPCTWHENGISFWGEAGDWRYEALLLPGLDSDRFGSQNWIAGASGSPYEFKIANTLAGAFRIDNTSVKGLRMSLSGYAGNSFKNTLAPTESDRYKGVKGTVMIGAFDFCYNDHNLIVRGNLDYGHLTDSYAITKFNMSLRKDSVSPQQQVASDAMAVGIEAGYDIFGGISRLKGQKLYVFGRYEMYDSMFRVADGGTDFLWCGRQRVAAGLNYYPMDQIVIKCEYSHGILAPIYNNEPSISLGVAFAGLFDRNHKSR
ncbi:MAG: hypothetical protein IJ394_00960 [Bacteroidales bacterium]|nr:hypothetical protein [Bacteroidales bacterium]